MTNLPPVNEETVIFKSDRQAAGKVCENSDPIRYSVSLLIGFPGFPVCPKKSLLILIDEQSRSLKF
jgi:hypothetical protein